MQPNPFKALLMSRKFWLGILDMVVSFTTYFVTKYVAPEISKDVLFVLAGMQPLFIALIGAIAWEDAAEKRAGVTLPAAIPPIDDTRVG